MHTALWIVAGLMAALFTVAGGNKLLIPYDRLARAPLAQWVRLFSPGFVKTLGGLEVLGAAGLVLPAVLDTAPVLVPLAASGLSLVMVGAAVVNLRLGHGKHVLLNLVYLVLVSFVAWGRFVAEPLTG